eukprot:1428719-Prymnesium_polylepis.1
MSRVLSFGAYFSRKTNGILTFRTRRVRGTVPRLSVKLVHQLILTPARQGSHRELTAKPAVNRTKPVG